MKKPNLFIIGQHKSGTTAIRDFLSQHPDIYFPDISEMHHFESDLLINRITSHRFINPFLLRRYNTRLEYYLELYKIAEKQKVIGDNTPSYLFSKTSAMEIFNFNPKAKLIALFREPVSYLYSLHSQNLYNLYEDEKDFEKALTLEDSRKNRTNVPSRGKKELHMLLYSQRIKYADQLKRFLHLFPKEQLKCILFEDFQASNEDIMRDVFRFLGVDDTFSPTFARLNPNKRRRFKGIKNLINLFARTGIPAKIIPAALYGKGQHYLHQITTKYEERKPLDPILESELKRKFKADVVQFNDLLHQEGFIAPQRDLLKTWKYDAV